MIGTKMLYAYLASNLVAVAMLLIARRFKNVGRGLYIALFGLAALWNMYTVLTSPGVYRDHARWAAEPHRTFILGWFSEHTGLVVGAIAAGQLTIAVLLQSKGRYVRIGLAGAIAFLVSIAPLGVGAAFPSTLVVAAGATLLFRRDYRHTLYGYIRRRRRAGHWWELRAPSSAESSRPAAMS